jgi:hypothetical protein
MSAAAIPPEIEEMRQRDGFMRTGLPMGRMWVAVLAVSRLKPRIMGTVRINKSALNALRKFEYNRVII